MMECAREVKDFLTVNNMKQTDDITDFLIIGTPGQRRKVQFNNINICEANISASDKAQNLGFLFIGNKISIYRLIIISNLISFMSDIYLPFVIFLIKTVLLWQHMHLLHQF